MFGIVNTLALSIFERTRELGLLRAVGMTRSQVRSTIRWESVIISVLGALFGIVVGVAFGWAIVSAVDEITVLVLPVSQLVVFVLLAALLGIIAAIGPARRASKVDVLRAVTTE
jgi:putative ABC transport system permease protein